MNCFYLPLAPAICLIGNMAYIGDKFLFILVKYLIFLYWNIFYASRK